MIKCILTAAMVLGTSQAHAHAGDRVGVVVTGDAALQPAISAEVASWLQHQGHTVEAAPLPGSAINGFIDCFVLEDTGCASEIVRAKAHSDAVVYARIDTSGAGPSRSVTITAHWIGKHNDIGSQKTTCKSCSDDALQITLDAMLATLAPVAAAGTLAPVAAAGMPAAAAAAAPAPAAQVSASAPDDEAAAPTGFAFGAELGEPTAATVGFFGEKVALAAAIGSGTFAGPGISIHADVLYTATRLSAHVPLRVGLGGRFYHHGYDPQSIDEIPHEHYGIRVPVSIAFEKKALQIYAEAAPGVDVYRSMSCTLADGPRSICPHAQQNPLFVQLVVGARWFISK